MFCGTAGLAAPEDHNRSSGFPFKAGNIPGKLPYGFSCWISGNFTIFVPGFKKNFKPPIIKKMAAEIGGVLDRMGEN